MQQRVINPVVRLSMMPIQTLLFPTYHATPFLKWAGGKSKYLKQLSQFFPSKVSRYIEPFVGAGSVYFCILARFQPDVCLLSDLNADLIQCYETVRDECQPLITRLEEHKQNHSSSYYYKVRDQNPKDLRMVEAAARFIYLNKTCFNGLYRVNQSGEFNVPMGSYKAPKICEPDKLMLASHALAVAKLRSSDFASVCLSEAQPNDFVYLDPPYQPISTTAHFTKYTSNQFGRGDQIRLAEIYRELDRRGCYVMLNNSDSEFIWALYRGYRIETIQTNRSISSNAKTRGMMKELVVLNY